MQLNEPPFAPDTFNSPQKAALAVTPPLNSGRLEPDVVSENCF